MSRRKERARGAAGAARGEAGAPRGEEARPSEAPSRWSLRTQIAVLIAVFALVTLVAELAGAANLGVALGIGQVAFAIAAVSLLVRG